MISTAEKFDYAPAPAEEVTPEERASRVIEGIAEDARQSPGAYLRETLVPEGGE